MKKLLFSAMLLFTCISFLQAQKLVPEKANPSFGPYPMGPDEEVVIKFKNTDAKPAIITHYFPQWLEEEQDKLRMQNGPQPVITIAPGKTWELKFRIPTRKYGIGKHDSFYMIHSNATNLQERINFKVEITKPPYNDEEEGGKP